jgi:hypothetical protein
MTIIHYFFIVCTISFTPKKNQIICFVVWLRSGVMTRIVDEVTILPADIKNLIFGKKRFN